MSDDMTLVVILLGFLGTCGFIVLVFVGFVVLIFRGGKVRNDRWAELAKRTGMTLKPGGVFSSPAVNGEFRGRQFQAGIFSRGGSRYRRTFTDATVTLKRPVEWRLKLSRGGALEDFFGGSSAAQDIQVGNPQFDEQFKIRSDHPERAQKLLGRAGTQALITAIPDVLSIEVAGQELRSSQRGGEESPDALLKLFNTLSDLADAIEA